MLGAPELVVLTDISHSVYNTELCFHKRCDFQGWMEKKKNNKNMKIHQIKTDFFVTPALNLLLSIEWQTH